MKSRLIRAEPHQQHGAVGLMAHPNIDRNTAVIEGRETSARVGARRQERAHGQQRRDDCGLCGS
jgi:hypothetical protein